MKKTVIGLYTLFLYALMVSCSPNQVNSLIQEGANPQLAGIRLQTVSSPISVKDSDGKALSGAEILIGSAPGHPFNGNILVTDSDGNAQIPAEWTEPASVSVFVEGYTTVTYLNQSPGSLNFKLRPEPPNLPLELRGLAGPLPIKQNDGWADFALVMPTFTRMEMISFDISRVISEEMDKISAMGQVMPVPSNISIPKQQERYGIFNVTFEKPIYRTKLNKVGRQRIYAIQGKFPFVATADALRGGKSYFDILNSFVVTAGGLRDVTLKNTTAPQNLNIPTQEMAYDKARIAVGPQHRSDEYYLGVSLAERSGHMFPTDFKRLAVSEKAALRVHINSENLFLGILKKKSELESGADRMSVVLLKFSHEVTPRMLPLIADPRISRDTVQLPALSRPSGIHPLATYAVLSSETVIKRQGQKEYVYLRAAWEVYSQEWISSLELPTWKESQIPRGPKRWEINFVGSQTTSQAPAGPVMLNSATHVTHSSASF